MRYDGHDRQNRWVFPSKTTRGAVNESDYESYAYDEAGNRAALRKRGDLRRRTWIIGVALMLESELAQR